MPESPRRPQVRMYIDEVGNHDLRPRTTAAGQRFLSLTGVIVDLEVVATALAPRLEQLKHDYFGSHPDAPLVLHRKELVNAAPPFHALRDPMVAERFNAELLGLLSDLDFKVVTAVIDKLEHERRYNGWVYHPYHYCLMVLIERYVMELHDVRLIGDVMAEARGGREDTLLKAEFTHIYEGGTWNLGSDRVQDALTSRELKIKPKQQNIAGLQLADMLAHPSWKCCTARRNKQALDNTFGGQIAQILVASKYRRSWSGRIEGYGLKWLP